MSDHEAREISVPLSVGGRIDIMVINYERGTVQEVASSARDSASEFFEDFEV